jgi:regulator of protease activity HflC (stomatin/prohibitin superfamily)
MELQVAAERQKRAHILESEGERQSQINKAEAQKQQVVLASEGAYIDQVNRAKGEAEAIVRVAEATAESVEKIAKSAKVNGGTDAISLKIAEQYVEAFAKLAKKGNTLIIPANAGDAGGMIAQALSIFTSLNKEDKIADKLSSPWVEQKKKK